MKNKNNNQKIDFLDTKEQKMEVSTHKILTFDGNVSSWSMWKVKFQAKANLSQYGHLLKSDSKAPNPINEKDDFEKFMNANNLGFNELILAMKLETDLCMVADSTNSNLPGGDLKVAWDKLNAKYEPKDTLTKIDLIQKLDNLKLEELPDCERWMTKLETIRRTLNVSFNKQMSDEDLIMTMYKNLPNRGFEVLKVNFMRQLTSTVDPLTMEGFQVKLRAFMRDKKNSKVEATALIA